MVDLVIIGGGPAGLAAACKAWESGLREMCIGDRVHDDFHVVLPGSGQLAPGAVLDTRVDEVQVIKDALECRLLLQELLALIGLQHGVTGCLLYTSRCV